jgi:hypothetical protein
MVITTGSEITGSSVNNITNNNYNKYVTVAAYEFANIYC